MVPKQPFQRFTIAPKAQGMYDPRHEKDACGLAMVATLRGTAGHDIIELALEALRNLEHRGAIGSDAGTGDGAGIVTQIPDAFLRAVVEFELPQSGHYVVGSAFLPTDELERAAVKTAIEALAVREQLDVLGWRVVPVQEQELGSLARAAMPAIEQLFLTKSGAAEVQGLNWTGSPIACANRRNASSTCTSRRCPAAPWFTRAW